MRAVFGDHTSFAEPGQRHILQSQKQPEQRSAVSTMTSCSCLLACVQLAFRELEERFSILAAEHGAWSIQQAQMYAVLQLHQLLTRQALDRLVFLAGTSLGLAVLPWSAFKTCQAAEARAVPCGLLEQTELTAARLRRPVLLARVAVTVDDLAIDGHNGDLQLVTADLHRCLNDIRLVDGTFGSEVDADMPPLPEARIPELTFETDFLNHTLLD